LKSKRREIFGWLMPNFLFTRFVSLVLYVYNRLNNLHILIDVALCFRVNDADQTPVDSVADMSNDFLLIKTAVEQINCEQSDYDYVHAAVAVMPVVSLTSSADTSQDSDNKDSATNGMSRKPVSITIDIDDAAAKERRQIEELEFRFLCVDLRILPGYLQFLTCCGGVFFFYLIYAYCQVSIYS